LRQGLPRISTAAEPEAAGPVEESDDPVWRAGGGLNERPKRLKYIARHSETEGQGELGSYWAHQRSSGYAVWHQVVTLVSAAYNRARCRWGNINS